MEIYEAGGGIHFTVEHTRRASEDQLYHLLRDRLMRMLHNGLSTHQYQIRAHILVFFIISFSCVVAIPLRICQLLFHLTTQHLIRVI